MERVGENMADALAGIDYSKYGEWEKVTLPSGTTLFLVPGTGYAYDPFLSSAKGRPVLWNNPKNALEAKRVSDQREKDAFEAQRRAQSPLGQILPVAGSVAGTIAANQAVSALSPATVAGVTPAGQVVMSNGSIVGQTAGQAFTNGATAAGSGSLQAPAVISTTRAPEAAGAAQAGFFESGGLLGEGSMSAGQYVPGVAGAYGMYDLLSNKRHGTRGALQGAASGAGIGWTVGGPVGAGVGAVVGGTVGYFGNFGDFDRWKTEGDSLRKLKDDGVYVPENLLAAMPTKGRTKEELVELAQATGGNVKFAGSRDEKDLSGADIVNYSAFAKNDPNWFTKPLDQRISLAQSLLDAGAVREHHGTIDIDWNKAPGATPPTTKEEELGKQLAMRMNQRV